MAAYLIGYNETIKYFTMAGCLLQRGHYKYHHSSNFHLLSFSVLISKWNTGIKISDNCKIWTQLSWIHLVLCCFVGNGKKKVFISKYIHKHAIMNTFSTEHRWTFIHPWHLATNPIYSNAICLNEYLELSSVSSNWEKK